MTTAPRLTVNLSALKRNWQALNHRSPQAQTAAVVKADAYGIGIEQVVPALAAAGCRTFFVAMVEEGTRARAVAPDARIFILNGIFQDTVAEAVAGDLVPVLSTLDQIALWASAAPGKPGAIHADTGMNRLGLSRADAERLAANASLLKRCGAGMLMSHLACADDPDHPLNSLQLDRFRQIANLFSGLELSLANSAAVLSAPDTHFGLTRPGVAIYGGEALNDMPNPMEPVVRAETRILQIRHAKAGETVGYGATQKLERDTKIAVCSSGYADGYHRAASGSGVPLRQTGTPGGFGALGPHRVPVLGRVSMDLTAFDITDVPEAAVQETRWIELFGSEITLDEAARACGTIGYELLTGLGHRYRREYVETDG